jgi:hypothetical protein
MLAQSATTVQTHTCTAAITNATNCHQTFAEGCTTSQQPNTYDPFLNFLKNQTITPAAADAQIVRVLSSLQAFQTFDQASIQLGIGRQRQRTFADDLATIGQGNIYAVIGYLYYAVPGGRGETCNCKLTPLADSDFHLGIGFDATTAQGIRTGQITPRASDPDPLKQASVVAEMTPHYRTTFHPTWTLPGVQALAGKQVKVIGQLLIDNEHNDSSQNCAFIDADRNKCWRASAWEMHPITRFFVCNTTAPCAENSANWVELDTLH